MNWLLIVALITIAIFFVLLLREHRLVGIDRSLGHAAVWLTLGMAAYTKGAIRGVNSDAVTTIMLGAAYAIVIAVTLGRPGLFIYAADKELDRSNLSRKERAIVKWSPWLCVVPIILVTVVVGEPELIGL